MSLYINRNSGANIYNKGNEVVPESNQASYRENFLENIIEEQQQLNKEFVEKTTETAEKNEMYNQALLEQISFQEKLLQNMYHKLKEYEQTSNSLYEQMQSHAKMKEVIERHHDLQNIYHQTVMERFDKQESLFKDQMEEKTSRIVNHFDQGQTEFTSTIEQQEKRLTELLSQKDALLLEQFQQQESLFKKEIEGQTKHVVDHLDQKQSMYVDSVEHKEKQISELLSKQSAQLIESLKRQETRFEDHFDNQELQLEEFFINQENELMKRFDQHTAINERLDRKLDFIKSAIFERAADVSEKLDEHMKKFTDLFSNLFSKQENNHQVDPDSKRKKEEDHIKLQ